MAYEPFSPLFPASNLDLRASVIEMASLTLLEELYAPDQVRTTARAVRWLV